MNSLQNSVETCLLAPSWL